MKKILVTGCAGFLGSQISKLLIKHKYKVYGIDNLSTGSKKNLPKSNNFTFKKIDCSKLIQLKKIKFNFDFLIHLAGQASGEKSYSNPRQDFSDNVVSTVNLLELIKNRNCKYIIFASSMAVYGNSKKLPVKENYLCKPNSFYGLNKLFSEKYIRQYSQKYNKKYIILRLFNIYGPGQKLNNLKQGMIRIYLQQIFNKKKLIIKGPLNRIRDFIFIDDVTNIFLKIIKNKFIKNETYNIGSGFKTKIKNLVFLIRKKIPFDFKVYIKDSTPNDVKKIYASITKAKKNLKFKPKISLDDGIEKYIKNLQ